MLLLQSNNIPEETIKSLAYLTQFAYHTNFFIYQGHDGRTLIHRDVISFDGRNFKCHDSAYETYIGTNLLPCVGIIIPDESLNSDLYAIRKESNQDILEDTKMMTIYLTYNMSGCERVVKYKTMR